MDNRSNRHDRHRKRVKPLQLAMILCLAENLTELNGNTIEIFSQEANFGPKRSYAGHMVLQDLGINSCLVEYSTQGHILDEITPTTLVYTPVAGAGSMARALKNRNPELYIGSAVDWVNRSVQKYQLIMLGDIFLDDVTEAFVSTHERQLLEPVDAENVYDGEWVSLHGGLG